LTAVVDLENSHAGAANHVPGSVCRSIVDDDDLAVVTALIEDTANGASDEGLVIVARDDHGQLRTVGHANLQPRCLRMAFGVGRGHVHVELVLTIYTLPG
jgi:hypothetical protein